MSNLALFDLDGTLIDSSELYFIGVPMIVHEFLNIRVKPSQFMDLWGQDAKRWLIRFAEQEERFSEGLVTEMYAAFERWYSENHAEYIKYYDGVEQLLAEINETGTKIGIVTTRPQQRAELAFDLSWGAYIDFVVGGDLVKKRKPAPDSIDYAIESNNAESGKHFYLGDNASDVIAAQNSNYDVTSVGGLWGAERRESLIESNPEYLFETVDGFRNWCISNHSV